MYQDSEPLLSEAATLNSSPSTRVSRSNNIALLQCLKRSLMMTVFVACSVISFLYWTQSPPPPSELNNYKPTGEHPIYIPQMNVEGDHTIGPVKVSGDSSPQWTWLCVRNTCERTQATNSTKLQSLTTCNRFCGHTHQLWPQPTGLVSLSDTMVRVSSDKFALKIIETRSEDVEEYLRDAFALFNDDLRRVEVGCYTKDVKDVYQVIVEVSVDSDRDPRLRLDTDESYKLTLRVVNDTLVATVSAHSFCGARNGLETLSQLVWADPYVGLLAFQAASVQDEPKFKYRGILLDTSRNFFPVKDIIRTLDAMSANKLNTFHWHATDSQSFPLMLESVPELVRYGAYGPAAIYTTEDIRTIVRRARLRGIRVVIEIDAPAHVGSAFTWGPSSGLGDLAHCVELSPWKSYCGEPPCGQLNPTNSHVYELLERIYAEIIELTGVDDVFHLGGDEVNAACWQKHIRNSNPMELWFDFMQKIFQSLQRANGGKTPELTMVWSSRLTQNAYLKRFSTKQFAIQLWGASEWLDQRAILDAGFRSVISHVNAWYLDCGYGSWRDNTYGHCGEYRQWTQVYEHRPWSNGGSDSWRIEGGTACMWAEQLGPGGLDSRLWPRGIALAERLWSDPEHKVTADVGVRLDTQRSRMVARGIGADPLWPKWCTQNPTACLT